MGLAEPRWAGTQEVWSAREEFKGPLFCLELRRSEQRSRRARHGCELSHGEGKSRAFISEQEMLAEVRGQRSESQRCLRATDMFVSGETSF